METPLSISFLKFSSMVFTDHETRTFGKVFTPFHIFRKRGSKFYEFGNVINRHIRHSKIFGVGGGRYDNLIRLLRLSSLTSLYEIKPCLSNRVIIALIVCLFADSLSLISFCVHPSGANHKISKTNSSFTVSPCFFAHLS